MAKNNIYVLDWMSNLPLDMESVRAWRCPKLDSTGFSVPGWLVNILLASPTTNLDDAEGKWFVIPKQIADGAIPSEKAAEILTIISDEEFYHLYYRHIADMDNGDIYLRMTEDKRKYLPENWDSAVKYRREYAHPEYHYIAYRFDEPGTVDRAPRWALEALVAKVLEGNSIVGSLVGHGFIATIDVYGTHAVHPLFALKKTYIPVA